MQDEKAVLDGEDIRRTLVRIAHEIVEQNAGERVAIVGIHRRGAVLAARIHELLSRLVEEPVPLGDIDIAFYRDDLHLRSSARQPVVHASHIDFPVGDHTVVLYRISSYRDAFRLIVTDLAVADLARKSTIQAYAAKRRRKGRLRSRRRANSKTTSPIAP